MLLNIFAEPVSKVLEPRLKTLKKLSTTLKMSYMHCKKQSLSDQASEFRNAYGVTNGQDNRKMQLRLIAQEYEELTYGYQHEGYEQELKELADLVYVCFQYAENMDWDLEDALDRVHKSNMSKLGLDGKPIRRQDGKVLKGPKYQPPNLTDLVS